MKTYNDGLRAAARLLICTAEDFEQCAKRLDIQIRNDQYKFDAWRANDVRSAAILTEKATVLRGQSQQILQLQVRE